MHLCISKHGNMISAPTPRFIDSNVLLCLEDLPTRQRDLFSQWMEENGLLRAKRDPNYADYMVFSFWFQHYFLPQNQFNPEELL